MFNIVPLILYQIELHCLSALFPDPSTLSRDLAEFFPIEVSNAEATCFFLIFLLFFPYVWISIWQVRGSSLKFWLKICINKNRGLTKVTMPVVVNDSVFLKTYIFQNWPSFMTQLIYYTLQRKKRLKVYLWNCLEV